MSDTNKHFKFDLDRKLKSWLKFEPNFLKWLPNGKIEKTTVYLLFSLFIQFFSKGNQTSLFPRKAYDTFIRMTGQKWSDMLVGELLPFWQSSISRQIRHVFSMRVPEGALNHSINYAQKGCTMQMQQYRLQVNIENIYLYEKKLENIFKNWLCCQKNLSCQKFWGACKPPRP